MRHFSLIASLLFITLQLFPQVLINEFSSSNAGVIKDEDGDFSDWIELFNPSASDVSLGGYYLSDNAANLSKWVIPAITLKPGAHQLIFASGKNRQEVSKSYQTVILKGDSWKYLVPASEPSSSWKNPGFNASSWKTGPSGFGYGDGDDATVLNNVVSVYVRKEFTITNVQDINELVFTIDFDDGFVAYINGKEIARYNLGAAGTFVPYNQTTGNSVYEAQMYQGKLPINYIFSNPRDYLVEGTNVIAVQGHNTNNSSDFSLIPMLTVGTTGTGNDGNYPDYIMVLTKQLHTNFSIRSEGETLIFSNPDSSVVDSISPVLLLSNISYGRKPDGQNSWFYFAAPTPGATNSTTGYDNQTGDTVKFSAPGGFYPGGLQVSLSVSDPADSIVYTLDGSEPTAASSLYTVRFTISGNTVLRAKALNHLKLPGMAVTNTYIVDKHTLPVVCISTDPANLWDYNTGIYVLGPNASTENPFFGANFWQDWERKAHIEIYDKDGTKQIDQDAGIKIFGSYSRANAQKSMAMYARAEYGKGSFNYRVFNDKPIEKFESLIIRNAGNDWPKAIFRDGLTSTLVSDMDMDRMAFQPSVVYLNGEYWGIENLREKVNENFLAGNHGVDPDKVNLLEANGSVIQGSNAGYAAILSFLNTHTLEAEQDYLQVSSKMDINNYIQYQLTEIFVNNTDWPGNNIKFWNTSDPGSLYRWILYDTDFGLSLYDNPAEGINTLQFALATDGPSWPNPPWSTFLLRRMLSNPAFRNEFINQYADRLNTNFKSSVSLPILDSLVNLYNPEIQEHLTRWGLSYPTWLNEVSIIRNYLTNRPAYARGHIRSELGVADQIFVKIDLSSPGSGSVKLNSIIPKVYPFTGIYFRYVPVRLTAIPSPGYKFVRWEGSVNSTAITIDYDMALSGNFKAVFELAAVQDTKIVINEINYNSSPEIDTKDWVELYNAGVTPVNLRNWVISDGAFIDGYVFPADLILYPGMYLVVCKDMGAFKLIHPSVSNITGDFLFGLGSTGDDVNLFDPDGVLMDWVNYAPNYPWPANASGTGATIELTNPQADNNDGTKWRSSIDGGTPGALNRWSFPLEKKENLAHFGSKLECFPNPFRDYTTLRIEVPGAGKYKLEVYDLQGRLLNIIAEQHIETGAFYIDWEGKDSNNEMLPLGVYIVRLTGENLKLNLKVIKVQ